MLNAVDDGFLQVLQRDLPAGRLAEAEPRHLTEPRGKWPGRPGPLALPRNTAEVSVILSACNAARVPVVTWGGGTGLVAGQVMAEGPLPLILSLEKMTEMRGIWPEENTICVEAGMTLAAVRQAAQAEGRLFPLSLASEGSATIGGNLATNAGGTQVLRYGNARELCLGIEAVLASGEIIHGLKRLRKDNTGYDLRNLILGSEGTLAVITAASLRLFPNPKKRVVALLAVASPAAAQQLLRLAEAELGGLISGFELMSRMGFDFLAEGGFDLKAPFDPLPDWLVLIELGLPAAMDAEAAMAGLYAQAAELDLVQDGVISASEAQADHLWALRETIPDANRRVGSISSHDVSLPLGAIPGFIEEAGARLRALADIRINCFGHLGDGNLHFNLFPAKGRDRGEYAAQAGEMSDLVHEMVDALDGSVSAEHGIGRLKTADLQRFGDPARLDAMRRIKTALDPNGILNPGAVLPL
ncbi:FAD-binding oxidoreductase [Xinfangfangia sp. D13-10-4-6]|uniref:FAD-binding oxidoreductase n=1 Tax=Pseudogemmobacter hezensis TaxID=2737662 RepID=UPI0015522950|nr:FAD-binding oxidoreductase [Pseudogemmobacter hezensis]NPD15220.1 FAD-binding oxidoreductase [Pseudogemmobacter hezensis]